MREENLREAFKEEVEWIEITLTGILDEHATEIPVTARSKR